MKNIVIYVTIALLFGILLGISYANKEHKKFRGQKNTYQIIQYKDFKKLKEENEIVIVDVRSYLEYQTGHIEGAINIPLNTITETENLKKILPDTKATYVIYCRSGNRSKTASEILLQRGYENVFDLGGIENYPGPIIKGDGKSQ